jgi:hypothetical protein
VWGMKATLLILAGVMGQSVLAADKKPLIADPMVEEQIRLSLKKPMGGPAEADLEKVTVRVLTNNQLTHEKDLEKLTEFRLKSPVTRPTSS